MTGNETSRPPSARARPSGPRLGGLVCAAMLIVAACGGGAGDRATGAGPARATPAAPTAVTPPPEDLALVDANLDLDGPASVDGAPGLRVGTDLVLENGDPRARRISLVATDTDSGLDLSISPAAVRLEPGQVVSTAIEIRVPGTAAVGDGFDLTIMAIDTDDTDRRAGHQLHVGVVERAGEPPTAGDDRAATLANEKVTAYVIGNDTDPDGDLDLSSLRVVGGGFRSNSVEATASGTITYTPFRNLHGRDAVVYEICDGAGSCDTGVLVVDVE